MLRWLCGVAMGVTALAAGPLQAQPGATPSGAAQASTTPLAPAAQSRPITGRYQAPPECPDAQSFWQAVSERTATVPDPNLRLEVNIERRGGRYVAVLSWFDAEQEGERQVEGQRCGEASTALALVTALALDARAQEPQSQAVAAEPPLHWALEAGALLDTALAPAWALGGGVAGWLGHGDWQFALGLAASLRGANAEVEQQRFRVDLWALKLQPCVGRLNPVAALSLAPCVFAELGMYHARARSGFTPLSAVRELAGSVGAELRLQWDFSAHWAVVLAPAIQFPLRSGYQLVVQSAQTANEFNVLHEIPRVAGAGSLSLRWTLH